jgi:creatinine amidohydrolase
MAEVRLGKMTWPEVKARLQETDVVLLPTGAIEQHGPHLPLDTDIAIAEALAVRIAEAVADDVKAVVAPSLPVGASAASMGYPGSLTLDEVTLLAVWEQIVKGLLYHGFKKIIVVNGHGGNLALLTTLTRRIFAETGAFMATIHSLGVGPKLWGLIDELLEAESGQWRHACEIETSLAMALGIRAEMALAINEVVDVPPQLAEYWPYFAPKVPIPFSEPYDQWQASGWEGVMGDARLANLQKGERLASRLVEIGAQLVRNIHTLPVTLKPFSLP